MRMIRRPARPPKLIGRSSCARGLETLARQQLVGRGVEHRIGDRDQVVGEHPLAVGVPLRGVLPAPRMGGLLGKKAGSVARTLASCSFGSSPGLACTRFVTAAWGSRRADS